MTMLAAGILGVALLALNALLAVTETVLLRLNIARAMRMQEDDLDAANALVWLLEHRGRSLNAVLLQAIATRVTLAVVVVTLIRNALPSGAAEVGAVVVVAVLSMVLGEVVPRTVTARSLESVALRIARPARLLVQLTGPLAGALVTAGRAIGRTRSDVSGPYPGDDELQRLLDVADEEADDPIEDEERQMIRSIFELGDTLVREIMVPRPDMVMVGQDASLRELVNAAIKNGRSRIPVFGDTRDEIAGLVYAKDVLRHLAMQPGVDNWASLIRPVTFVPEAKRVDELLRDLQEQAVHLALVVDEYGAVVGLVTIEDILEEIVGEIVDEHDHEEPLVVELSAGCWRVDARLPVDELAELLGAELPQDGWDSVGGLVFGVLGRVPGMGESVEIDGLRLTAERVQGRRISRVVVDRLTPAADDATSPARS